ncbi:STAS domain-containing protein [Paraliomyxa miuraensis]|uniref:STAS domain-containing protein n=1 Tax=Paraliomyxa miuraensis TaxID=376150 RepID=UPI00224E7540|nr:STAS domain-containing protein [Paraliomyxa miuraensis]MCX4239265.1 STAS domain-containing protein [Paraliomyxa miuraensis]
MSDEELITIERSRLESLMSAVSAASVAAYDEALTEVKVRDEDGFGELEHVVALFIDELRTTAARRDEAMRAMTEARATLEEKLDTIRRQQVAIRDLSAPIIDLWEGILTLPIVGTVDSQRAVDITEKLLQRISENNAACVIIDLTGVDVVDTMTADHLIKLVKSARLLGTYCVVTGIGPEIARTLVDLGVELHELVTLKRLREGLQACLTHLRERKSSSARWGQNVASRSNK